MPNPDMSEFLKFARKYFYKYLPIIKNFELYQAVAISDLEAVRKLIHAGANVNYLAIKEGNLFDTLCDKFPSSSILHFAALTGRLDVIKELLKNGANVAAMNDVEITPLIVYVTFCKEYKDDVIKELVMYGSSIHHKDLNDDSSLHYSLDRTRKVDMECCKALLRYDLFRNYKRNFRAPIKNAFKAMGRDYGDIADYLNLCNSEILRMRRNHVGYLSLHEFLLGDFFEENHRGTGHDYTIFLLQLLEEGNFPIYSDIILDCIKTNHLVSNLTKTEIYAIPYLGSEKVILNPDTIHHLTTFLTKDPLVNLLRAFHVMHLNSNQCSELNKYSDSDLSNCSLNSLCHLRNRTLLYNKSCSEVSLTKTYKSRSDSVQPLNSLTYLPSIPAERVPKKVSSDVPLNDTMNLRRCVRWRGKRAQPYSRQYCVRQKRI